MLRRTLIVLSYLLLVAARIDVAVHSCLDMTIENTNDVLLFSVTINEKEGAGAVLVPVLGFESYHDNRLAQRGSCSNIASGTTGEAIQLAAEGGEYISRITGNGWERRSSGKNVTYSKTLTFDELKACTDSKNLPILRYQETRTAKRYVGTFYLALVQLQMSDSKLEDFARYIQPHQFYLSEDGVVHSVSDMQYKFNLSWVGNTWTPSNDAIVQLKSTVTSMGRDRGHFRPDDVEIVTEKGQLLTLVTMSDCVDVDNTCIQDWYLRTKSLSGNYRITAQLSSNNGIGMLMTAMLDFDLQQGETHESQPTVESTVFRGENMTIPYISTAISGSSIMDGETICLMLQNNNGDSVDARAARICTSTDMDLIPTSEDGQSGCNTPDATGVTTSTIFDHDENIKNSIFSPIFKTLERINQHAFCFTAKKMSENNHIVEVEFYTEDKNNVGKRGMLSFEWDRKKKCPRELFIECPDDCDWKPQTHSCVKKFIPFGKSRIWCYALIGFFLLLAILIGFCATGHSGGWYHPIYPSHGWYSHPTYHKESTYQQMHNNSHNTYKVYKTTHNNGVIIDNDSSSEGIDINQIERARLRKKEEYY